MDDLDCYLITKQKKWIDCGQKNSDKKWASHMNTPHNANRPNQSNKQAKVF
jgi:hypothetical protein